MARRQRDYVCIFFGVLLIVVGIVGFIYPEITFKRARTIKFGPVSVEEPKRQVLNVPPLVAAGIITSGIVLLYISMKKP